MVIFFNAICIPRYLNYSRLVKEIDLIIKVLNDKSLNNEIKDPNKKYLIITKEKLLNFKNQYVLNDLPIKLTKLIEKFNIEFLKQQFNNQSDIKIRNQLLQASTTAGLAFSNTKIIILKHI